MCVLQGMFQESSSLPPAPRALTQALLENGSQMLFACHVCFSRTGCNCAEAWSLSSATLSRPCYSCSQRGPQGKRFTLGTKLQSVHATRWCPRGELHYHGAAGLKQCMHYILAVQKCKLTSSQSFQPSYCWWIFNLISTWRIISLPPDTHLCSTWLSRNWSL